MAPVSKAMVPSALSGDTGDILLSIVIPTFNRQLELSMLLEQLSAELAGVREGVELLVSDNDSTDETGKMLREFVAKHHADLAIRCFTQPTNVGAIMNLHFLIEHSIGRYVWAIGDDDALVPGKLRSLLDRLRAEPIDLLLLRTEGVFEWGRIPRRSSTHSGVELLKVSASDPNSANYLFAGGFLGSVIIRNSVWREVLPEVEGLHETCYSNWAAVLKVASKAGDFYVIDEPCVRGNFNMRGESKIPPFRILVLGRLRVWAALDKMELKRLLTPGIRELAASGWAQIALGKGGDVIRFSEKIWALKATLLVLGVHGSRAYFYALVSLFFPFPSFLRRVREILRSC